MGLKDGNKDCVAQDTWGTMLTSRGIAGLQGAGCCAAGALEQRDRWTSAVAMADSLPRRRVSPADIQVSHAVLYVGPLGVAICVDCL